MLLCKKFPREKKNPKSRKTSVGKFDLCTDFDNSIVKKMKISEKVKVQKMLLYVYTNSLYVRTIISFLSCCISVKTE